MESSDQTPQAPQNDAALPASPADAPGAVCTGITEPHERAGREQRGLRTIDVPQWRVGGAEQSPPAG